MFDNQDMDLYNPFDDKYVSVYCEFEIHVINEKCDSVELTRVVSKEDVDMFEYVLEEDRLKLEAKYKSDYNE